jgi:hypothetical protein
MLRRTGLKNVTLTREQVSRLPGTVFLVRTVRLS